MSIAGILRRWVLVSAVTGVLALIQVPGVRAQAVSSSPAVSPADVGSSQPVQMPPNPNPNQPVPTAPSPGPLNSPANGVTGAPGWRPERCPGWRPERCPGRRPERCPGWRRDPAGGPRRILVGSLDPGCDLQIDLRRHLYQGSLCSLDASHARRVLRRRRMGHALRVSEEYQYRHASSRVARGSWWRLLSCLVFCFRLRQSALSQKSGSSSGVPGVTRPFQMRRLSPHAVVG